MIALLVFREVEFREKSEETRPVETAQRSKLVVVELAECTQTLQPHILLDLEVHLHHLLDG